MLSFCAFVVLFTCLLMFAFELYVLMIPVFGWVWFWELLLDLTLHCGFGRFAGGVVCTFDYILLGFVLF